MREALLHCCLAEAAMVRAHTIAYFTLSRLPSNLFLSLPVPPEGSLTPNLFLSFFFRCYDDVETECVPAVDAGAAAPAASHRPKWQEHTHAMPARLPRYRAGAVSMPCWAQTFPHHLTHDIFLYTWLYLCALPELPIILTYCHHGPSIQVQHMAISRPGQAV